jgi:hypothetical protein
MLNSDGFRVHCSYIVDCRILSTEETLFYISRITIIGIDLICKSVKTDIKTNFEITQIDLFVEWENS